MSKVHPASAKRYVYSAYDSLWHPLNLSSIGTRRFISAFPDSVSSAFPCMPQSADTAPPCLRSFSRLLAFEAARILFRLGCDVRVYNPAGLPQKDDIQHDHHKVQELRELSKWSDGHVWVSPEQHGNLVGSLAPGQKPRPHKHRPSLGLARCMK